MNYYLLNGIGDVKDKEFNDYCMIESRFKGVGLHNRYASEGKSLNIHYPSDPFEVSITLTESSPGIKLSSYLGNINGDLIVHKEVAETIGHFNVNEIEIYPFTFYNHKERVHSKDYVIVNPIGGFDCLNLSLSKFERRSNGEISAISEYTLDQDKMKTAPDLFRVQELPRKYVFSEKLVNSFREQSYTNMMFTMLNVKER